MRRVLRDLHLESCQKEDVDECLLRIAHQLADDLVIIEESVLRELSRLISTRTAFHAYSYIVLRLINVNLDLSWVMILNGVISSMRER